MAAKPEIDIIIEQIMDMEEKLITPAEGKALLKQIINYKDNSLDVIEGKRNSAVNELDNICKRAEESESNTNLSAAEAEKSAESAASSLEELKNTVINIHNSVEGDIVSVADASDKRVDEISVYGRSSQSNVPTMTVPVDIVNTFDNLTASIYVSNKNLLATPYTKYSPLILTADKDDYNEYTPRYPFYVIEGQTYTFSFESDGDAGGTSGTDTVQAGLLDVTNGIHYMTTENKNLTFTAKKTGKCSFRCDVNKNGCTHRFWNFQVEVGDVKTEYVEGNKQSIEIALSEPLRCIPVKSGGNYTNDMGQQYLADVICVKDGQIGVLRYINYVRLTSSGFIIFKEYDSGDKISFQKSLGNGYYNEDGMCTHFEFSHSYNINTMWLADTRVIFTVASDYNLDTFKDFLDNNEVYLAVTCKNNPTFEVFDDNTQSKIKSIATYYGITNVCNNEGAYTKLNYVTDTKLYIDNKINELAKAITATESEV